MEKNKTLCCADSLFLQIIIKAWRHQGTHLQSAAAKSLQPCPTLCDPIGSSPPGAAVPGILQARTLEWGATSFSNAWKWKVKVKSLSHVRLLATPWTAAHQAPLSMGFSRQEYWRGVSLLSPNTLTTTLKCLRIHLHSSGKTFAISRIILTPSFPWGELIQAYVKKVFSVVFLVLLSVPRSFHLESL